MGEAGKVSFERLKAVVALLEERGVSKADLARAIGKGSRPGTINDWLANPARTINYPADRFEEAVAGLMGEPRRVLDPFSYVMGSLVGIEDDAQRILARIQTVRETVGVIPAALRPYGDAPPVRRVAEARDAHHAPVSAPQKKGQKKARAAGGRSA